MNFYSNIHFVLKTYPDRELIIWPDEKHPISTGKSILQKVNSIAGKLKAAKVQMGEEVLIAVPVSPELISGILAIMAIGAVPVLPPAAIKLNGIYNLVKTRKIKFVLIEKLPIALKFSALLLGIKVISTANTSHSDFLAKPENVDPDQAALISHSSGSTGNSKAIKRSHTVLLAQHQVLNQVFPPLDSQNDFPLFPNVLLHNLCNGTLSILPQIAGFKLKNLNAEVIFKQLLTLPITTLTGNVFYFQKILEYAKKHNIYLNGVKALGIGGSPVPEYLAYELKTVFQNADIFIIYGSSEAEPIAIRKIDSEKQDPANGYCVGEIVSAIAIQINSIGNLNFKNGGAIPVGEIEVKGPHVAVENTNKWLKTGDFGYIYDQKLFLTGRKGNETIYKGVQHYQIEHVLQHTKNVDMAAAIVSTEGFQIFVKGTITETQVRTVLENEFPSNIFNKINLVDKIATDDRHLSKILYNMLQ